MEIVKNFSPLPTDVARDIWYNAEQATQELAKFLSIDGISEIKLNKALHITSAINQSKIFDIQSQYTR